MDSSSEANILRKPNIRKGKVKIEKVEEKSKRCVTFSKRKLGLFNKITELSLLCQAETALVMASQKGKLYVCGYPDPDSVISRYYGVDGGYHQGYNRATKRRFQKGVETLRLKYEATQNKFKEENMHLQAIIEAKKNGLLFTELCDLSVEDMGFEEVEQFKNSIEDLKMKLAAARERKKKVNSLPPLPVALSAPVQSLSDISLLDEFLNGRDGWGWTSGSGVSSIAPSGGFGQN